jgi:hypothetical protein
VLKGLPPIVHRNPELPNVTIGDPIKEWVPQLPYWGEKRGNLHNNNNPARGKISIIYLFEENFWNSRRKYSKPQQQGHKGLKYLPKQLQTCKPQCRMKHQDNCSPSKANSTTKVLNT